MKLLTIPVPGEALTQVSTLPKKRYAMFLMVGASVAVVMTNFAPRELSNDMVVPSSFTQLLLSPAVKSVT